MCKTSLMNKKEMINIKRSTDIYKTDSQIRIQFENFIRNEKFPCVAATAALKGKR